MSGSRSDTSRKCAFVLAPAFRWRGRALLSVLLCAGCAREPTPVWRTETEALLEHELDCFTFKESMGILCPLTGLSQSELLAGAGVVLGPNRDAVPRHASRLLALAPDDFGKSVRLLMTAENAEARMAGLVLNRLYGSALSQDELLRVIEDDESREVKLLALFALDVRRMIQDPLDAYQRLALLCLGDGIGNTTRNAVLSRLCRVSEDPSVREHVVRRLKAARRPVEKEVFLRSLPHSLRDPERDLVVALSRDESPLVRRAAVECLFVDVGHRAVQLHLDVFRVAIADGDANVRIGAAIGLGVYLQATDSIEARQLLIAALKDVAPRVRVFAAQSLMGQEEAVKALVEALDDTDAIARNQVLRSLARTVEFHTAADSENLEGASLEAETERVKAHVRSFLDRRR